MPSAPDLAAEQPADCAPVARTPILLFASWALLAVAWTMGNPPFAAPDEAAHYLRALGVSEGRLIGSEPKVVPEQATPTRQKYADMTTRDVKIPGKLAPQDPGCYVLNPQLPATCIDTELPVAGEPRIASYVGDYEPLPYLLPAALTRVGDGSNAADRWGRIGSMIPALAMLALALALLWDPRARGLSMLGLVVAVTPMVMFCTASLTGSGLEITAGIAFAAALLRIWRDDGEPAPWVWAALAAGGALLALSRSAAPAWIVVDLIVFVAVFGVRRSWELVRRRRGVLVAGGVIAAAIALNRVWESLYGPDVTLSLLNARFGLRVGWDQLPGGLEQLVIAYGYLEFRPPTLLWLGWLAILVAVVAAGLIAGARRERIVLAATAVVAPFVPLVLFVLLIRHTGFGIQGRHVLPLLVVLPLLGGEVVRAHRERLAAGAQRALVVGVPLVAALGQLTAWWLDARRAGTGVGHGLWFIGDAQWAPPLGWWWWAAAALVGAVLLAVSLLLAGADDEAEAPAGADAALDRAPAAQQ
jgi:hypothetical protein